jgi:hypothetical protein
MLTMTSGAVLLRLAAAAALAVALVLAAGCGFGEDDDFEQSVRESRDQVDDTLAQVTDAGSFDDLLRRLRLASREIDVAATDLAAAEAPDDLETEKRRLVRAYRALSGEVGATASALDDFTTPNSGAIQGINFDNWTRVQRALTALRREGVDVRPLFRHGAG